MVQWDAQTQSKTSGQRASFFESFTRRLDTYMSSVAPKIEAEAQRMVNTLNDKVVPQVRRQSSSALHTAAIELHRMAEYLERGPSASTSSRAAGKESR